MADDFFAHPRDSRIYYIRLQLARAIIEAVQTHCKDARLLDYGCGTKPYYAVLSQYLASYIGADLPDNPQADLSISEDGTVNLPECSVDAVLSTQVLEHVPYPMEYLQECHRILNDSGILILTTHGHWRYHPHPTDYWRWTNEGLRKILLESGFEIVEFKGIMSVAATGLQFFQDEAGSWPIRVFGRNRYGYRFQRIFIWMMQRIIEWVDSKISQARKDQDACVFLMVAQKNPVDSTNEGTAS